MAGIRLQGHDLLLQVLVEKYLACTHDGAMRDSAIENDTPVRVDLDVNVNSTLDLLSVSQSGWLLSGQIMVNIRRIRGRWSGKSLRHACLLATCLGARSRCRLKGPGSDE